MLQNISILNKCCSLELYAHQRILVYTKIWSSTTCFQHR